MSMLFLFQDIEKIGFNVFSLLFERVDCFFSGRNPIPIKKGEFCWWNISLQNGAKLFVPFVPFVLFVLLVLLVSFMLFVPFVPYVPPFCAVRAAILCRHFVPPFCAVFYRVRAKQCSGRFHHMWMPLFLSVKDAQQNLTVFLLFRDTLPEFHDAPVVVFTTSGCHCFCP